MRIIDRSNHTAAGLGQAGAAFTQQLGQTQQLIAQLTQRDEQDQQAIAAANERARVKQQSLELDRQRTESTIGVNSARQAQLEQETLVQGQADELIGGLLLPDEQEARDYIEANQGEGAALAFDALPNGGAREKVIKATLEQVKTAQVAAEKQDLFGRIAGAVGSDAEPGLYTPEEVEGIQRALSSANPGTTMVEVERDFARREQAYVEKQASIKTGEFNAQAMTASLADPQVLSRLNSYDGKQKAQAILSEYEAQLRFRPEKVDHGKYMADFEVATSSPGLQDRVKQITMRAEAAERALSAVTGMDPSEYQGLIAAPPTTPGRAQLQAQSGQSTPVSELDPPALGKIMTRLKGVAEATPEDMGDEQLSQILVGVAARMGVRMTREELFDLITEAESDSQSGTGRHLQGAELANQRGHLSGTGRRF